MRDPLFTSHAVKSSDLRNLQVFILNQKKHYLNLSCVYFFLTFINKTKKTASAKSYILLTTEEEKCFWLHKPCAVSNEENAEKEKRDIYETKTSVKTNCVLFQLTRKANKTKVCLY